MDEDDLLRKEDDWLVEEDRVPTPNPSYDNKDGQDDPKEKDACSSIPVILDEQHEDRRIFSTPHHPDGE